LTAGDGPKASTLFPASNAEATARRTSFIVRTSEESFGREQQTKWQGYVCEQAAGTLARFSLAFVSCSLRSFCK
jgi:hypothetical protein